MDRESRPFPKLGRNACGICGEYPSDPKAGEELRLLRELEKNRRTVINISYFPPAMVRLALSTDLGEVERGLLAALDRHREGT